MSTRSADRFPGTPDIPSDRTAQLAHAWSVAARAFAWHRYGVLFVFLLGSLILLPLLHLVGLEGDHWGEALLAMPLVVGVLSLEPGNWRRIAVVVLVLALVARPGAALLDQVTVSAASLLAWGILALVAAASALRYSLQGSAVTSEHILAALSTYLMVGFYCGVLFFTASELLPGALVAGNGAALDLGACVYFSFVTLASLGYGDILPVAEPVRGLAVIEVVAGQLYLAVLVARLVGLWASGRSR